MATDDSKVNTSGQQQGQQTKLETYAQIQALVQKEAKDIATKVYSEMGTKYGVAEVPVHKHNGADAPILPASSLDPFLALPFTNGGIADPNILVGQTINDTAQANNPALASTFSSPTVYVDALPIIYGQTNGNITMTGTPGAGSTSATLATAWAFPTTKQPCTFGNGDNRTVSFTKGSTSITWSPGISAGGAGSTALALNGAPFGFAGGNAPVGTMIIFANPSNPSAPQLWARINSVPSFTKGTYTLTASQSSGSTGGTLTAAWTFPTGTYWITFSSGETRPSNFTNNSTAVTWGALTASATSSITVSAVGWWGVTFNQLIPG